MADTRTTFYATPADVSRIYKQVSLPTTIPVSSVSTPTVTLTTAANRTAFVVGDEVLLVSDETPMGERFQMQSICTGTLEMSAATGTHTTTITVRKLSPWMSYRSTSSVTGYAATPVSAEDIIRHIETVEAEVEQWNRRAWRAVTVTDRVYNWPRGQRGSVMWWDGIRLFLGFRNIRTWDATVDKIEVHEGSADYTNRTGSWTVAHNADFWIDYNRGYLYLKKFFKVYTGSVLRLTFRHGETTVPKIVRDCVAAGVAARLSESEWGVGAIPATPGGKGASSMDRAARFRQEYERLRQMLCAPRSVAG